MESLIRDLNDPSNQGSPDRIHDLQRQIQKLQKDPSAWQLGLDLLQHEEDVMRFYGALTIGIKVSNDWENDNIGTDRNLVAKLIEQLVTSFVLVAQTSRTEFVLTKLASTLAAVFAKPDSAWAFPCRQILASLLASRYLSQDQLVEITTLLKADAILDARSAKALLLLATALQEEFGQSKATMQNHNVHVRLSNNATDIWSFVLFTLTQAAQTVGPANTIASTGMSLQGTEPQMLDVFRGAMNVIAHWTSYVSDATSDTGGLQDYCRKSIALVLASIESPLLATDALTMFTTLENDQHRFVSRILPGHIQQIVTSDRARESIQALQRGDFSSPSTTYVDYLEAVLNQIDPTTPRYLEKQENIVALQQAQQLLQCNGVAALEDTVCRSILEVLSTTIEGFSDWPEPSQFDDDMKALVGAAANSCLRKIAFPAEELERTTQTWDEDERAIFEDFRFDVQDFLQTSFGVLGPDMALNITQTLKRSEGDEWASFEAVIYALVALSDAMSNDFERCDPCLDAVFDSAMWSKAITSDAFVPTRVTHALIRFLGETTGYLQRHQAKLVDSLNFLFQSLQVHGLGNVSSKAILSLCDSERLSLIEALPQFLQSLAQTAVLHGSPKYRIFSAVGALIQALPSETARIEPIEAMLSMAAKVNTGIEDENIDEVAGKAIDLMQTLAAISKGLQAPADTAIDLEPSSNDQRSFWVSGPGHGVQSTLLNYFTAVWSQQHSSFSVQLVSATCDFLRYGFTEQHPSPCKFTDVISVQMLQPMINLRNPNLDQVMSTSCSFLADASNPERAATFSAVLNLVAALLQQGVKGADANGDPKDFEAAACILDLLARLLPRWGIPWLQDVDGVAVLSLALEYSMLQLNASEILARRWAAVMISAFVDASAPNAAIMCDGAASSMMNELLQKYCVPLLSTLIRQLGGECARSEIEVLTDPLRKFFTRQPQLTKRVLNNAIKDETNVLTQKALTATKIEQRSRFVAQMEALRGARKSIDITKDFWLACKGSSFGYIT